MSFGVVGDESGRPVKRGSLPDTSLVVMPGNGIGVMASQGNGRAGLERKGHHARASAGLFAKGVRKCRYTKASRRISTGRFATVRDILEMRICGAGGGFRAAFLIAVIPGICNHAVCAGKCAGRD